MPVVEPIMTAQPETDGELLAHFRTTGSEAAFRALVEKYLGMVFGLALRRTGEWAFAEEVAQNVFTALARRAGSLEANPTLAGWLYRCTMYESTTIQRREFAHQRKMKAFTEHTRTAADGDNVWRDALPLLDEAIDTLSAAERNLILLRFFERRNFGEIGAAVGKSGEAARKQCDRALEKLAHLLARKGVAVPVGLLIAGLTTHLAQATPTGLAWTISKGALTGVSTLSAKSLILKTIELMVNTKTKTALAVAVAAAVPLTWQWYQNNELKNELARLRDQPVAATTPTSDPSDALRNRQAGLSIRRSLPATAPVEPVSIATEWEKALLEPDPLRRSRRISELLNALTAEDAAPVAEVFLRMRADGRKFDDEHRLFLRTWGTLDGIVAVTHVWENSGADAEKKLNSSEMGAVIGGWATVDPVAARAWIEALPESKGKEVLIYALLDGWSLQDFAAASAYATTRPRSEARDHFRALLLERALASDGINGAQRWFADIPDDDHNQLYKQRSFDDVVRAMLYRDPAAAAQWISANAGARYLDGDAVTETARRFAQSSPTETLRWLETLRSTTPAKADQGAKAAMTEWSKSDSTAAASYLQQQANQPIYDTLADAYARGIVSSDPENALVWAKSLHDQKQRDETVKAVAGRWVAARGESGSAGLRAAGYGDEFIASLSRDDVFEAVKFHAASFVDVQRKIADVNSARELFLYETEKRKADEEQAVKAYLKALNASGEEFRIWDAAGEKK